MRLAYLIPLLCMNLIFKIISLRTQHGEFVEELWSIIVKVPVLDLQIQDTVRTTYLCFEDYPFSHFKIYF